MGHFFACSLSLTHRCAHISLCRLRLLFIQEQRPNIPTYIIPDSVADTFRCISPTPVSYSYGPEMQNKVREVARLYLCLGPGTAAHRLLAALLCSALCDAGFSV